MLKKITSQGDWIVQGKNIKTSGGTFVGYASKEEDAKVMALSGKFLELLKKSSDLDLVKEVNDLLKAG